MPRPLSTTRTPPSASSVTSMRSAMPGQRLVDGVVDDLPHQVVQPALGGGADVHAGALADRLQPLQDGDRAAGVGALAGAGRAAWAGGAVDRWAGTIRRSAGCGGGHGVARPFPPGWRGHGRSQARHSPPWPPQWRPGTAHTGAGQTRSRGGDVLLKEAPRQPRCFVSSLADNDPQTGCCTHPNAPQTRYPRRACGIPHGSRLGYRMLSFSRFARPTPGGCPARQP